MERENFSFTDPFGKKIECLKWIGGQKPKAIVQIVHGMAEHAARYDDFAKFLVSKGFDVYANDHRGHGRTAETIENTGFFADTNGWEIVTENLFQLSKIIKNENPGIPLFVIGHSMGSLLSRNYISKFPGMINGVILSGTSFNQSFLLLFGKLIANIQLFFSGKKHRSKLLDRLSFGSFNKKFKPNRTNFDWLSRDEKQVDAYVQDEYCGFICTTSFYADLFSGILKIQNKNTIRKIPLYLPVFIISGEMDTVGDFTKGVNKVYESYKEIGLGDLEKKIYRSCRHEILNEINKEEVYNDILNWLNKHIN